MLIGLHKLALLIVSGIDERNVAVIDLGRFVKQVKDTGCARKRHGNGVDVLRSLVDVHTELTGHTDKGNENGDIEGLARKRKIRNVTADDERTADENDDDVKQVTDIAENRNEDIGETVCAFRITEKLFVDLIEILFAGFFMAEDLDDLLTVHHFFDIALFMTERFLLANKVMRASTADGLRYEKHQVTARKHDERQPYA